MQLTWHEPVLRQDHGLLFQAQSCLSRDFFKDNDAYAEMPGIRRHSGVIPMARQVPGGLPLLVGIEDLASAVWSLRLQADLVNRP